MRFPQTAAAILLQSHIQSAFSFTDIDSLSMFVTSSETIIRICEMYTPYTPLLYEPPRGKTNNVVSNQVRYKPACAVTEDG